MNAPFRLPVIPAASVQQETDRAFWLRVIAEMNLKPGISLGPVNPDRSSFDAWRC